MGQAKAKAAQFAQWKGTLSDDERIVLDAAMSAHSGIVRSFGLTGACYRLAFLLAVYLLEEYRIEVRPVVGFVCDGESELMVSHAWIEVNGRKTDISLTMTEHPHAIPSGALLVLDREMRGGDARYTYHTERGPDALAMMEELLGNPRSRNVALHKEAEHKRMTAIAKSPELMRKYLDAAPDGMTYEVLAARIRHGMPAHEDYNGSM